MKTSFEASQILRWGTPGWIFLIIFVLLNIVDAAISGTSLLADHAAEFGTDSFAAAILLAGAGVPIGYLIYQIYFYFRWNWKYAGSGFWFMQGRVKGIYQTLKDAPLEKWPMTSDAREEQVAFLKDFQAGKTSDFKRAWHIVETLLVEGAAVDTKASTLYDRSRYLLDMLHALGTGMWAILLGWAFFIIGKVYTYAMHWNQWQFDWSQVAVLVVSIALLILLLVMFQGNRSNTRDQVISLHNYLLRDLCSTRRLPWPRRISRPHHQKTI